MLQRGWLQGPCEVWLWLAEHNGVVAGGLAAGEGLPAPEEISAVMASPAQHQLPMPPAGRGTSAASPGGAPGIALSPGRSGCNCSPAALTDSSSLTLTQKPGARLLQVSQVHPRG